MTIEQINEVDAIGIDNDSGRAVLTLVDHLDWSKLNDHLLLLQEKLNTYIRFIESGEITVSYPSAVGRPVLIDIVGKEAVPPEGLLFLDKVKKAIGVIGISIRWSMWREEPKA